MLVAYFDLPTGAGAAAITHVTWKGNDVVLVGADGKVQLLPAPGGKPGAPVKLSTSGRWFTR